MDREIAALISSMLCITAPPAMFMQLHECAGDTDARIELRQAASAWCKGKTASEL